jgi:23S rRNA pseudouridine2605 synthase
MLNKPRGYVTTLSDEQGRKTVADLVADCGARVYPVGRLDLDSEGLLLMTNDGDFMQRLTHPSHEVSKEYHVSVFGPVQGAAERLRAITDLDGEPIRPAGVKVLRQTGQTAELAITIHEGKNRQIRRMCAACGLTVKRLRRVREHDVELGSLPQGKWRYLTETELQSLKD